MKRDRDGQLVSPPRYHERHEPRSRWGVLPWPLLHWPLPFRLAFLTPQTSHLHKRQSPKAYRLGTHAWRPGRCRQTATQAQAQAHCTDLLPFPSPLAPLHPPPPARYRPPGAASCAASLRDVRARSVRAGKRTFPVSHARRSRGCDGRTVGVGEDSEGWDWKGVRLRLSVPSSGVSAGSWWGRHERRVNMLQVLLSPRRGAEGREGGRRGLGLGSALRPGAPCYSRVAAPCR